MEDAEPIAEAQAKDYDKVSFVQQEAGENLIGLIRQLSPRRGSRCILDLGCGTGTLIPLLSEYAGEGGRVVGVDPDTERLQKAREKHEGKITNAEILKGSDEDFPEGPYDLVFSNYVIHWIKNKAAVFKKVYQNLEHGGQFAFTTIIKGAPINDECQSLMDPETRAAFEGRIFTVPPEDYDELATSQGFITTYRSVSPQEIVYPNVDCFLKFFSASTHGMLDADKVPKDELESFKRQFGDKPIRGEKAAMTVATFILTKP